MGRSLVLNGWMAGLFGLSALAAAPMPALATSTSVQYDYDSLGRVCRARYQGGQTINYGYDANSNRKVVSSQTTGGATTSTDCPMVTSAAAPASTARPRNNTPPAIAASLNADLCVTSFGSACPEQQVNVLRFAWDWDFEAVTVISAAMQSGPGTVRIDAASRSIWVTPPSSATTGTPAQVIFTISDGHGGTATSYLNINYVNY